MVYRQIPSEIRFVLPYLVVFIDDFYAELCVDSTLNKLLCYLINA